MTDTATVAALESEATARADADVVLLAPAARSEAESTAYAYADALVAATLLLLCISVLATPLTFHAQAAGPPATVAQHAVSTPSPWTSEEDDDDEPDLEPPLVRDNRARGRAAGAQPAGQRPPATAPVTATFTGTAVPTQVEITCDSGFRDRQPVDDGSVTVPGVPTSGSCRLHLKGAVASSVLVLGRATYACVVAGTTTACR